MRIDIGNTVSLQRKCQSPGLAIQNKNSRAAFWQKNIFDGEGWWCDVISEATGSGTAPDNRSIFAFEKKWADTHRPGLSPAAPSRTKSVQCALTLNWNINVHYIFFGNGKIFSVLGRVTEAANPRPAPHHQSRQGPPPLLCHLLEYCPPLHRLQLQIHLFLINRYWHIFYSVIFKLLDTYFPRIIILDIFCRQYITSIAPFCRRARWCSRKGGRTY